MGEEVANVHFTAIKVYRSDQPIFVAADVEHDKIPNLVSAWEGSTQFIKTAKVAMLHDFEPAGKRTLAIGMSLPKLALCFS